MKANSNERILGNIEGIMGAMISVKDEIALNPEIKTLDDVVRWCDEQLKLERQGLIQFRKRIDDTTK